MNYELVWGSQNCKEEENVTKVMITLYPPISIVNNDLPYTNHVLTMFMGTFLQCKRCLCIVLIQGNQKYKRAADTYRVTVVVMSAF